VIKLLPIYNEIKVISKITPKIIYDKCISIIDDLSISPSGRTRGWNGLYGLLYKNGWDSNVRNPDFFQFLNKQSQLKLKNLYNELLKLK